MAACNCIEDQTAVALTGDEYDALMLHAKYASDLAQLAFERCDGSSPMVTLLCLLREQLSLVHTGLGAADQRRMARHVSVHPSVETAQ